MKNYRVYVEKKPRFRVEAESLRRELNANLGLELQNLRLLNVYDLSDSARSCWRGAATRSSARR